MIEFDKKTVGAFGEKWCEKYAKKKKKLKILAKNKTIGHLEADIIAYDKEHIVFIEVKTRSENQMLEAKDSVTLSKQKKIILTAMDYISKTEKDKILRFDVFEVIHKDGKLLRFRKTEGAFEADERVLGDYHF